jgi:tRNA 2-thiouridine synthesizing protein A
MTQAPHEAVTAAVRTLDTSGSCCPMPIVLTRQAITGVAIGEVLEVIATDPGSRVDFPAWARNTGHELLAAEDFDDRHRFLIRRTK